MSVVELYFERILIYNVISFYNTFYIKNVYRATLLLDNKSESEKNKIGSKPKMLQLHTFTYIISKSKTQQLSNNHIIPEYDYHHRY